MKSSERVITQLKLFEGFTPVAKHLDADRPEVITGGYGFTDVTLGETFTEEQGDARLRVKVSKVDDEVSAAAKVPLDQNEFDGLVLLTYNIGAEHLLTSTLLRKLNAGDYEGAAEEFLRWVRSAGKVRVGLIARRRIERAWFLGEKA